MAKRYTKAQKRRFNTIAVSERCQYRLYLRGSPSSWNLTKERWWRKKPHFWSWMNEPPKSFLAFDQLIKEVGEAGINLAADYRSQSPLHNHWPAAPERYYEKWVSWPHLFGRPLLALDQLKKETKEAGVTKILDYDAEYQLHKGWPSNPDDFYGVSWTEIFEKTLLTLNQLKREVKRAKVDSCDLYDKSYKLHKGWPSNPDTFYGDEWIPISFRYRKLSI